MHKEVAEDDLNAINLALDVKDHYNKSIDAYHEMAQLKQNITSVQAPVLGKKNLLTDKSDNNVLYRIVSQI